MSAWYVWSALGFFPETPGTSDLALGSPMFTNVTVTLGGGGTITDTAPAAADNAPYVQSMTLNGAAWNNAYLPATFATGGGTLAFTLGTTREHELGLGRVGGTAVLRRQRRRAAAGRSTPGPTGPIKSGIAGDCLDVAGNAHRRRHEAATSRHATTATGQTWTIPGDGSLQALGKCADVNQSGTANDTIVQLWTCNGSGAQRWTYNATNKEFVQPGVRPVPRRSGQCHRRQPAGHLRLQRRREPAVDAAAAAPAGPITSGIAGKCVDVRSAGTADGTPIQIYDCNGSTAQSWTVAADGHAPGARQVHGRLQQRDRQRHHGAAVDVQRHRGADVDVQRVARRR